MLRFTVPHPVSDVHEAATFDRSLRGVPRAPGVYVFYTTDLPPALAPFALEDSGLITLYVGQTGDSLHQRIEQHLFRDARVSTLRGSLGLLTQVAMNLELIRIPGKRQFCFRDEGPISDWLRQNTLVGFSECNSPALTEAAWLAQNPGLLNISGRAPTALSRLIRELRSGASGRTIPRPVPPEAQAPK